MAASAEAGSMPEDRESTGASISDMGDAHAQLASMCSLATVSTGFCASPRQQRSAC